MGNLVHPREYWQDPSQPITGPSQNHSQIDTFGVHYTAADSIPDDVAQFLRNQQNYYVTQRGYSLGYNHAWDVLGAGWEIRGYDIKCAANKSWNDRTHANLVLVDGQEPMSDAMVASLNHHYWECEQFYGRSLRLLGHYQMARDGRTAPPGDSPSQCPGWGVREQLESGVIKPERKKDSSVSGYVKFDKPERISDSRLVQNQPFAAGVHNIHLSNVIPENAWSINAVVSAINPAAPGYVSVWEGGDTPPTSVILNYPFVWDNEMEIHRRVVDVVNGSANIPCKSRWFKMYLSQPTHFTIDVYGYWV